MKNGTETRKAIEWLESYGYVYTLTRSAHIGGTIIQLKNITSGEFHEIKTRFPNTTITLK